MRDPASAKNRRVACLCTVQTKVRARGAMSGVKGQGAAGSEGKALRQGVQAAV